MRLIWIIWRRRSRAWPRANGASYAIDSCGFWYTLLKCRFQAARRSRSWETTLISQRVQIAALLDDSPSLRIELPESVERAYSLALRLAGKEMGMTREQWERLFPARCPWSPKQILDEDFYPAARK